MTKHPKLEIEPYILKSSENEKFTNKNFYD